MYMNKICWKGRAFKALSFGQNYKKAGRNFSGNITIFHRGGGSKKLLRRIDFQRKNVASGIIERIEYDPNRSARIALVRWSNIKLNNSVDQNAVTKLHSSSSSYRLNVSDVQHSFGSTYPNFKTNKRLSQDPKFINVRENQRLLGAKKSFATPCFRATKFLAHNVLDSSKIEKLECGYSTENSKEHTIIDNGRCYQRRFSGSQKPSINTSNPSEKKSQGCVSYILASEKLMPGDGVLNMDTSLARKGPLSLDSVEHLYQKSGISLPLLLAPIGSILHNIELYPGGAGKLARAAGTCAQLVQKPNMLAGINSLQTRSLGEKNAIQNTNDVVTFLRLPFEDNAKKQSRDRESREGRTWTRSLVQDQELGRSVLRQSFLCTIRLPSGQQKLLDLRCRATIGCVSNIDHKTRKFKKAGHSRWLGIRPVVRGVAMNPIDHPHGGGEGRTKGGRPSVSPWGKPAKRARRQKLSSRSSANSN